MANSSGRRAKSPGKTNTRNRWLRVIGVAMVLLLIPAILLGLRAWENRADRAELSDIAGEEILPEAEDQTAKYFEGVWYLPKRNLETTLVIGVDNNAERVQARQYGNGQADFVFLLVADKDAKTYTAIHINRDTMTDVLMLTRRGAPVRYLTQQLALSHAYGGEEKRSCENTIRSVTALLYGERIDHYLSLTMESIPIVNDLVGGVPVTVMDDFSGIDDTLRQGETVTLYGDHALAYVQSRMGMADDTNLHRMERQQQYLMSFQDRLRRCVEEDSDFVLKAINTIGDDLFSDCSAQQLSQMANQMESFEMTDYLSLKGETVETDYIEFYPDKTALRELVMQVFYEPAGSR